MPTSSSLLLERFAEIRAVAAAQAVVRVLDDYSREPSGKRFNGTRVVRRERWAQLAQLAQAQLEALPKGVAPAKRAAKPKVVACECGPGDAVPACPANP
jgi:hypothetical protein